MGTEGKAPEPRDRRPERTGPTSAGVNPDQPDMKRQPNTEPDELGGDPRTGGGTTMGVGGSGDRTVDGMPLNRTTAGRPVPGPEEAPAAPESEGPDGGTGAEEEAAPPHRPA
ncbi:MAG TPA: hypothetical protein VHS99_25495 [Chloroflexota bacterium]|jgi:hypothetical protein|nr:hypothetical protein [Chloroflexota bacterium]